MVARKKRQHTRVRNLSSALQKMVTALNLGLIAALCWGIHDVTIRYLSKSVPLLAALFTVLFVGALFQFAVLFLLPGGLAVETSALLLACCAGLAFLVASIGLYFAFERGPVRVVAPLIASYPILSILFALLSGTRVTLPEWIAVLAIVFGVALVAILSNLEHDDAAPLAPTIALSLVSACGFASTFKLGQMAAEISGELPTTLITRITALLCLAGIIWARRLPFYAGHKALFPLVIMGLLDGIALLCVISAAPLANPEYASVTSSIFGMVTILLAWAFLKERMSAGQWGACVMTFAGIAYLAL